MSDHDQYFLRDIWYHAAVSSSVPAGGLKSITLCGEPVVLARGADGVAYALRDICPHRGIPLSDGRMCGNEVECCYHGWKFNQQGQCTDIPSLTSDQRGEGGFDIAKVKVKRYPLREVAGQIFVWLGDAEADDTLLPHMPLTTPPNMTESMMFPCFIDHAVVGLMDPAHGPFVHQSWWWRSSRSIHEKAKRFGPSPYGFSMLRHKPSSNSKAYKILGGTPETEIRFQLPGCRIEHITIGEKQVVNFTAVTPLDGQRTQITNSFYWNVPWLSMLKPIARPFVKKFLGQDMRVVEQQQRGLAYNPALLLIKDADTMARWYYQLKAEYRRAREENRAFENPVKEQILKWRS